jgi:micrococcal nuclease|tara:strand:+ start:3228 stop:3773 length:546 start_codon:yes stop_codon:yes gene_type:complete
MGKMTPPSRKSCYNFRVTEINRVVDGDTIDVTIDLGFDLYKKERVRVAGIDTPEKRTRDLEEKALGIDATNWLKGTLEDTINGDDELTIRTELKGGMGKYGRLLGWLYVGEDDVSLNEQMIEEGYAWEYDGGTKNKNFEELREIRKKLGTLVEEPTEGDPLPEVGDGFVGGTGTSNIAGPF